MKNGFESLVLEVSGIIMAGGERGCVGEEGVDGGRWR